MTALRRLSACFALLLVAACSQGTSDLKTFVAEVRSRPSAPIEPIPQIESYTPYTYRASARREPFTAPIDTRETVARSTSDLRPNIDRPMGPLEAFPLDALRMVGTISANGVDYALIQAPDGVIYRVTRDDHLGQNYGEIVTVSDNGVALVEIVPDGMGGYMKRSASIALSS